jgi:nicotinate-nucleotide adenylyltransferase
VGHLLAAGDAQEVGGFDEVRWIPAATQPLKTGRQGAASGADRLAMVRETVGGDPRFAVDPVEIDRGGLSFMVDTVTALRAREPGASFVLLVGEDAVATLPRWRDPARLLALVPLVVLRRGAVEAGELLVPPVPGVPPARVLPTRRCDVSSTEVRARVAAGRSVRGFVTDAVAAYIVAHGLYGAGAA